MSDTNTLTLEEQDIEKDSRELEKGLNLGAAEDAADEIYLPAPSFWPITLAAGLTLLVAGLVSQLIVSAVGLVVMLVALGGWIKDTR